MEQHKFGQDLLPCAVALSSMAAAGQPAGMRGDTTTYVGFVGAVPGCAAPAFCCAHLPSPTVMAAGHVGGSIRTHQAKDSSNGGGAWADFGKCWACWGGPLLYRSRRDSQASSSLPARSAACILPSSRLCPGKRTAASPACAVVASVSLYQLSWFE